MADELQHATLYGRLVLAKSSHGDGQWLKVEVPQALIKGLFASLGETGIELPPGSAHISVMTSDEVKKIGASKITENGQSIPFRLEGVKHVRPSGWSGVSRVWFAVVKSPELKKLRASYGLSALLHGDHNLHITCAIRKTGVLAPNSTVTKHAFVNRNTLMGLGGGLAGAALGSMSDRKRKGNWMQRHVGALLGGIGGIGAGYGASTMLPEAAPAVKDTRISDITHQPGQEPTAQAEAAAVPANTGPASQDFTNLTSRDIATGVGRYIPAYMRQAPSGAEVRDADRIQSHGMTMPKAMPSAHEQIVEGFKDTGSALMNPVTVASGMTSMLPLYGLSGAAGATTLPAAATGALSGVGRGILQDVNLAGAGIGYSGAKALQNELGIEASPTSQAMNLAGARTGWNMSDISNKYILNQARPTAAKWFPKLVEHAGESGKAVATPMSHVGSAISKVAPKLYGAGSKVLSKLAPLARVGLMDAAAPAAVALDAGNAIYNSRTDAGKGIYDKYVQQLESDKANYGPAEAMARRIARGVFTPGQTAAALGYDLANKGGEQLAAKLMGYR